MLHIQYIVMNLIFTVCDKLLAVSEFGAYMLIYMALNLMLNFVTDHFDHVEHQRPRQHSFIQ